MPCYKTGDPVPDFHGTGGQSFATEEDCLDACAEGACCEIDGTCNIKPQCECDTDNGAVFKGVGETCDPALCPSIEVTLPANPLP